MRSPGHTELSVCQKACEKLKDLIESESEVFFIGFVSGVYFAVKIFKKLYFLITLMSFRKS